MNSINKKSGFSAIELLITLFIAAAFLILGFQLYAMVIKNSGESNLQARASNVANEYLQRYKTYATDPCTQQTLSTLSPTIPGLSDVSITVKITCPYGTTNSTSKLDVAVQYKNNKKPSCPNGFIMVPGSATYGTDDFCTMKYEAKNVGGTAVSKSDDLPWVTIAQIAGPDINISQGAASDNVLITDNVTTTNPYYGVSAGLKSVTVDLGSIQAIDAVQVWHYYSDGRTYHNTKTEVSADNVNWTTVFDSAVSGEYAETSSGKTTSFAACNVRYVRDWLNGSTSNTSNHWVEVKALAPSGGATYKASTACTGCHLMTKDERLTIAQNLLNVASNWSGGAVGSGYIYSGHDDNDPASSVAASNNDTLGYIGTNDSSGDSVVTGGMVGNSQRRTLTLSNNEVIWDFAGNVYEITSDTIQAGAQPGYSSDTTHAYREWNDGALLMNGMSNTYKPNHGTPAASNWTTANGLGDIYSYYADATTRAIRLGGDYTSSTHGGIYTTRLNMVITDATSIYTGFRATRSDNRATVVSSTYIKPTCPTGFIKVPGNSLYKTNDFCVMKYEAKDDWVGGARSTPSVVPFTNIVQEDMAIASTRTCVGCHLITEAEWLTIAQNVLSVPSNWSTGIVGSGFVYQGHVNNSPASPLEATNDDSNGTYGETVTGTTVGTNTRRTLTLTNGEVIWDFSGNVSEITSGTIGGERQPGVYTDSGYNWRDWNSSVMDLRFMPKYNLPSYGTPAAMYWTSLNGLGRIQSYYNETGARLYIRGGFYASTTDAGIYSLQLTGGLTDTGSQVGFRVAK